MEKIAHFLAECSVDYTNKEDAPISIPRKFILKEICNKPSSLEGKKKQQKMLKGKGCESGNHKPIHDSDMKKTSM